MRRLVVGEFITLDGVMQAPGGADEDTDGGFVHGGWTWPYWHDEVGEHLTRAFNESDALLLGRRTWQIHGAAFEPMAQGDFFADELNRRPKYVVSTTLDSADAWRNSTLIRGDAVEAVHALKQPEGKDIYIDGSSVLVQTLARHDLIDEYSLLVYPLVLGGGKRLFPQGHRIGSS
jgi:dihydrofolate reductase